MLNDHYHDFELNYDESSVRQYGYPRRAVSDGVNDHLMCGDWREGFARIELSRLPPWDGHGVRRPWGLPWDLADGARQLVPFLRLFNLVQCKI